MQKDKTKTNTNGEDGPEKGPDGRDTKREGKIRTDVDGSVAHNANRQEEGETKVQEEDVPGIRTHPSHDDLVANRLF